MRTPTEPIQPTPTVAVERPLLTMRWEALTYLHWALEPELVARRLPAGLEPDVHDGRAYVGLVPFRMAGIGLSPARLPLPQGTFPETNVRTYVVGPDGGRGVYFHSLDITRWAPTLVARLGYRLPYAASRMRLGQRVDRLAYLAERRWPGPRRARSHVVVELGERLGDDRRSPLDDFLSARWSLYVATPRGHVLRARVDHGPWPLRTARVLHLDDELVAAAGYAVGDRPPDHVLAGGDVDVRVGPPRRVA
jgi:uncharacterized protein YqjF (DUF2071 family)